MNSRTFIGLPNTNLLALGLADFDVVVDGLLISRGRWLKNRCARERR